MPQHRSFVLVLSALACHNTEPPKSEAPVASAPTLTASAAAVASPDPSAALPSAEAPASTTAPADNEAFKAELHAFLATRQDCSTANDCTNVPGSCPFGCTIPVAKSAEGAVKTKLAELVQRQEQQGSRCMYRCAAPVPPACVSGRCSAP